MLLALAFLMFAILCASWLVMPEKAEPPVTKAVEDRVPEAGTMPARA